MTKGNGLTFKAKAILKATGKINAAAALLVTNSVINNVKINTTTKAK